MRFLNKPPTLNPTSISTTIDEDSHNGANPKIWIEPFTVSDEESLDDQMTWSIFRQPFLVVQVLMKMVLNYFTFLMLIIRVRTLLVSVLDSGGSNNSLPRQAIAEVIIILLIS